MGWQPCTNPMFTRLTASARLRFSNAWQSILLKAVLSRVRPSKGLKNRWGFMSNAVYFIPIWKSHSVKSWSIHESESQDSLSPTLSTTPSLVPCGVAEQAFLVVGNPQCPVEEGQYEVQREKAGSTCGPVVRLRKSKSCQKHLQLFL